jgi:hypothetical protein
VAVVVGSIVDGMFASSDGLVEICVEVMVAVVIGSVVVAVVVAVVKASSVASVVASLRCLLNGLLCGSLVLCFACVGNIGAASFRLDSCVPWSTWCSAPSCAYRWLVVVGSFCVGGAWPASLSSRERWAAAQAKYERGHLTKHDIQKQ